MSARVLISAAVLLTACPKRVDPDVDPATRIAGGNVRLSGGGINTRIGAPVEVDLSFKDGSPGCTMRGAIQDSRDSSHRWAWLEPLEGCPDWLTGRWWGELAVGGAGWYLMNISTKPVQ